MIIDIHVKTGSSKSEVLPLINNSSLVIHTHSQPHDNAANQEIIKLLAKYFKTPKSHITIIRGHKTKHKQVQVL